MRTSYHPAPCRSIPTIARAILIASVLFATLSYVKAADTRIVEEMDRYDDEQVVRMLLNVRVAQCRELAAQAQLNCYIDALNEAAEGWKALRQKSTRPSAALDDLVAVKDNDFISEYAAAFYCNQVPNPADNRAVRFAVWKEQNLHSEHPIQ
jgi:hypothetical protein